MTPDETTSAAPGTNPPQQTVLLVEDAPATLFLCSLALRHAGYHVLEASDAGQAQSIARSGATLDLVVTDYQMPDMDGIELAQWFQHFAPRMKIILISATPENADYAATFLPAVRCFTKPDAPEDLVAIVQSVLGKNANP